MKLFNIHLAQQTDEQLMTRATHGNERAFEELYNRYARRLQGFFFRQLGGDQALAADFMQDVFLRAYAARKNYQEGRNVATWLYTIAYNLCKNRYRHAQTEAEFLAVYTPTAIESKEDSSHIERQIDRKTFQEALRHTLESLPKEARILFSLHYEEELTVPKIAEIMGIPEGTIKSRLHKTMSFIRTKLQRDETH